MITSNDSPLIRSLVAAVQKTRRKAQREEEAVECEKCEAAPCVCEKSEHNETDLKQPEERHEVDITMDLMHASKRIKDEELRSEIEELVKELARLHGVEEEIESLEEIPPVEEEGGELEELKVPGEGAETFEETSHEEV